MDVSYAISGTTPASASTAVVGTPVIFGTSIDMPDCLDILAQLVGATGGVLDLYLQTSPDGGTTWVDYARFPTLGAGAAAIKYRFGVSRHTQATTITAVGINATPALATNTVVGGPFGDRMRLVAVAGASTSAGAAVSILIRAQGGAQAQR